MQTTELKAELRAGLGKGVARKLRVKGKIPGILYGKGQTNIPVALNTLDVDKILRTKMGMNTLIKLAVDDGKVHQVMIKDYQGNALTRVLTHVDFLAVDENKELTVFVPVKITGKAEGIVQGGLLDIITRQVELLCKVGKIPEELILDVTKLLIGQNIHLADVALPEGAKLRHAYNPTLVTISAPKAEEVVAPVAAAATPEAGVAAPAAGAAGAAAAPAKDAKAGGKAAAAAPAKDAKAAAPAKDAKKK